MIEADPSLHERHSIPIFVTHIRCSGVIGVKSCELNGYFTTVLFTGKIPGKYQFSREPADGDCSVTISTARLEEDDGLWQCQVTMASLEDLGLESREAQLTIRGMAVTSSYRNAIGHEFDGQSFPYRTERT